MKIPIVSSILVLTLMASPVVRAETAATGFEAALNEAETLYKEGKLAGASSALDKAKAEVQKQLLTAYNIYFVENVGSWKKMPAQKNDDKVDEAGSAGAMGFGALLEHQYANGASVIGVSMVMDSRLIRMLVPLLKLAELSPGAADKFVAGSYTGIIQEKNGQAEALIVVNDSLVIQAKPFNTSVTRNEIIKLLQGMNYAALK